MRAGSLPLGLGNVTDMFINYVAKLFIHRASKVFLLMQHITELFSLVSDDSPLKRLSWIDLLSSPFDSIRLKFTMLRKCYFYSSDNRIITEVSIIWIDRERGGGRRREWKIRMSLWYKISHMTLFEKFLSPLHSLYGNFGSTLFRAERAKKINHLP